MNKRLLFFIFLSLFIISFLTLSFGQTPWQEVYQGILNRIYKGSSLWNPLLDERLPRLIVLFLTGASLAVSGAVMQSLFHNPLASPSVLGISSGGSLLVIIVFIFGLHTHYPFAIALAAFTGSLATLSLVYFLSKSFGEVHLSKLILTGIAITTVLVAIQGSIMYALRDRWQLVQMLTEWEAGSTYDRNWDHVNMQFPLCLIGLYGCMYYKKEMNLLALGEEEAKNLGVEVQKVRWRLFLCVALLTGGAIASVGTIAFFGLVLPHVIRRIIGPDNNLLIPLCILLGSLILATLDLGMRFFHIHMFSIGNISSILGGIFFLILFFNHTYKREFSKEGYTC